MTRKKTKFTAFLWHRRIGLIALVLVIILSITGIMLNHTESLKLDERYVDSSMLLDWYGLEPEGNPVSYPMDGKTITQWGQQIFFDDKAVTTSPQTLHGAVATEQFIVVAFDTELILLSGTGEHIERMPTGSSFSDIQRIGIKYARPVIETSDSLYYIADEHMLDWDVIGNDGITWSQQVTPSTSQVNTLKQAYRGKGLNMERVVLDLHSGRIFGQYGVYAMDAAAIALLWLSLSGLWVWWQRQQKQKRKRHYRRHHKGKDI